MKEVRKQIMKVELHSIEVIMVDGLKDVIGDYGQFEENDEGVGIIRLDAGLKDAALRTALYHEVFHYTLHKSGIAYILDEKLEEAIVRAMEYIYLPQQPKVEAVFKKLNKETKDAD